MSYKDWIVRYYSSHEEIPEGHKDGEFVGELKAHAIPIEWIQETMQLAETVGAKEYAEHLEVLLADWAEEREEE